MTRFNRISLMILPVLVAAQLATAATPPFTESFDANASNWFNAGGTMPAAWQSTGGADGGGYITQSFNPVMSAVDDTPVLFRAQEEFNSSGNAFVGNYLADGITEFSAFVRHDAAMPINFFVRMSNPMGFPGAVGVEFVPVAPNTWTEITIAIDPSNPQFVTFEGTSFNTVFSNIGHVQVGPSITPGLAGQDLNINFDLDLPTIVPEPTTGLLLFGFAASALTSRRRRSA